MSIVMISATTYNISVFNTDVRNVTVSYVIFYMFEPLTFENVFNFVRTDAWKL